MSFQTRLIAKHFFNKKYEGLPLFCWTRETDCRNIHYPFSFTSHSSTTTVEAKKKKKSKKKARQKYVKLAVCVACKVQLISHFVGYVNYYSQDLSVLFRIPDALELFDPLYFLKCHGGQKIWTARIGTIFRPLGDRKSYFKKTFSIFLSKTRKWNFFCCFRNF